MVQFDDLLRAQCLSSSMYFNRYFFKQRFNRKFVVNWHHELICEHLDKVLSGEIKRLAIRIAPRYGKTELAVKNFIAHGLAINPESKFIHLSYSSELAIDNSEEVRDFVTTDEYKRLFPYVKLSKSSSAKHKWYTESGGGVYATSTGGQITGFGAGEVDEEDDGLELEIESLISKTIANKFSGAIIIDDPIKPDDADSDTKRERINQRFETTIRSRTNSRNTPIIVIGQAVHERDLIGYLMETEPEEWTLLTIPAISLDECGNEVALWDFKHTLEELHKIKEADERTFNTQYQQNPQDELGLLLPKTALKFIDVPTIENSGNYLFCDPADTGGDKLSAIFIKAFIESEKLLCSVHESIHTTDGIFAIAPILYDKIVEYGIEETFVESNGVGLALIIALKQINKENDTDYKITAITSRDPKEVRIMRNYEFIKKHFAFLPTDKQDRDYKNYISDLTGYKRDGQNLHKKDAIDVSCQAAEILKIKFKSFLFKK